MGFFISLMVLLFSLYATGDLFFTLWDFLKVFYPWELPTVAELQDDPLDVVLSNMFLVILFIGQHKLMGIARRIVDGTILQPVFRSVYIYTTSLVLGAFLKYWTPIPHHNIWDVSWLIPNQVFAYARVFLLVLVVVQSLTVDMPYFLGIKQAYYNWLGLADPLRYKSPALARFIEHSPHPCFALILSFWLHSILRLDQFIFACGLTALGTQVKVEHHDVLYIQVQIQEAKKKRYN